MSKVLSLQGQLQFTWSGWRGLGFTFPGMPMPCSRCARMESSSCSAMRAARSLGTYARGARPRSPWATPRCITLHHFCTCVSHQCLVLSTVRRVDASDMRVFSSSPSSFSTWTPTKRRWNAMRRTFPVGFHERPSERAVSERGALGPRTLSSVFAVACINLASRKESRPDVRRTYMRASLLKHFKTP